MRTTLPLKHSDNVDRFRESIIRLGVKIDNGLEKPNQALFKAEKIKKNLIKPSCTPYTLTMARGAR
jgi:hypothetical protein